MEPPPPLADPDCRVTFDAAPGGLQGALLFQVAGQYGGTMMVEVYRAMAAVAPAPVMNVIADTRAAQTYMDNASFDAASRLLVASGFLTLNVVICDTDPARAYVARLGNAVSRLNGLQVQTLVVPSMAEAIDALAALMHDSRTEPPAAGESPADG